MKKSLSTLLFLLFFLSLYSQDTTEVVPQFKKDMLRKGYFGSVEIDNNLALLLFGQMGVSTVHGYKFNQYFQLGGVTGFSFSYSLLDPKMVLDIPLGVNIRGTVGRRRCCFFYSTSAGISLDILNITNNRYNRYYNNETYPTTFYSVPWFINPALGIQIFTDRKISFIIALTSYFRITDVYSKNQYSDEYIRSVDDFYPAIGSKFGIGW